MVWEPVVLHDEVVVCLILFGDTVLVDRYATERQALVSIMALFLRFPVLRSDCLLTIDSCSYKFHEWWR